MRKFLCLKCKRKLYSYELEYNNGVCFICSNDKKLKPKEITINKIIILAILLMIIAIFFPIVLGLITQK